MRVQNGVAPILRQALEGGSHRRKAINYLLNMRPGDVLAGQFSLEGVATGDVRACELSVLWHTEGKGDEDLSVHFFERLEPHNGESVDFRQPRDVGAVWCGGGAHAG